MKSIEPHVAPTSEFYVYFPSTIAKKMFFYPICIGNFIYEPGYHLYRSSYDGYLLMFIKSGSLIVEYNDKEFKVESGDFVLIDCEKEHSYHSDIGWESIWCHFDGPLAKEFYQAVIDAHTNIFKLPNPYLICEKMNEMLNVFARKSKIEEAVFSKQINDMMTLMLINDNKDYKEATEADAMNDIVSYIHGHFTDNISINELAEKAMLSPYYFIRLFKKKTGYTPHEYIINIRISNAKYLLSTSQASIKDICYQSGFTCESTFCTAFKKSTGVTPAEYRNK